MRSAFMLFTVVASGVFGLWLTFAPASYLALAGVPNEAVTDFSKFSVGYIGVPVLTASFWINNARALTTAENAERMMVFHSIGWFMIGAGGLYQVMRHGDHSANNLLTWQFAMFLVIAAIFFALRSRAD